MDKEIIDICISPFYRLQDFSFFKLQKSTTEKIRRAFSENALPQGKTALSGNPVKSVCLKLYPKNIRKALFSRRRVNATDRTISLVPFILFSLSVVSRKNCAYFFTSL
ncbi:MAG: hypothetical protein Q4A76_08605 [Porphyromonadaceae bacterium]|nr:hypothetical protein [Porphyromonadaceae bacterium]